MTMTREKIEQMRADMQTVGDHCACGFRVADLRALLTLAERALEPQGQALPVAEVFHYEVITYAELREPITVKPGDLLYASQLDLAQRAMLPQPQGQALPELPEGRSAIALCDEYGSAVTAFTADDMHAYARAYASQLALPAGPVRQVAFNVELPQKEEENIAQWVGAEKWSPWVRSLMRLALLLNTTKRGLIDYQAAIHFANELIARTNPSPAVAQPVAEERDDLPLSKLMDVFDVMLWNASTAITHQSALKAIEGLQTDFKKIIAQYKSEQSAK